MTTRIRVIQGGENNPKPDDADTMWFCPRCNGHLVITATAGLTWKRGKLEGGESVKLCLFCVLNRDVESID